MNLGPEPLNCHSSEPLVHCKPLPVFRQPYRSHKGAEVFILSNRIQRLPIEGAGVGGPFLMARLGIYKVYISDWSHLFDAFHLFSEPAFGVFGAVCNNPVHPPVQWKLHSITNLHATTTAWKCKFLVITVTNGGSDYRLVATSDTLQCMAVNHLRFSIAKASFVR